MSIAADAPPLRPMTAAQFLDWEARQEQRYEFVDGVARLMRAARERMA